MQLIEETYFGWDPLTHTVDCPNPVWDDVQIRRDEGARPVATGAAQHACANDICSHANTFGRVQVRLLCRDCGTVYTITGEGLTEACSHVSLTGWGQRPRQVGGVWLWPDRPVIPGGEPYEYLVTRQSTDVTPATVYGFITRYRDTVGTPLWIASAVPDNPNTEMSTLRWRHTTRGLPTLDDAAAWIATAETRTQPAVVVTV
jgi:hypothetical protein